jgi:hypothetical protein
MKPPARHERHLAILQALFLLGLTAGICALALWLGRAPAEAPELRIPVAELRSQATELSLLEREHAAGKVTDRFAHQHAAQLSESMHQTFGALASLEVAPELADIRRNALTEGRKLADNLGDARAGRAIALEDVERLRERLGILERRLQR